MVEEMKQYKDKHSDSGVVAYAIDAGSIAIKFQDGGVYLYDGSNPGAAHVAAMQCLAVEGQGLNTYVNKFVRDHYSARLE
jgi:hypothetical protein